MKYISLIVLIVISIYSYSKNSVIKSTITIGSTSKYSIVSKYCRSRGGSAVFVYRNRKKYKVEIQRKLCRELSVGDKVELYYSRKGDFLFIESDKTYERLFWFSICLLLIITFYSFIRYIGNVFQVR